MYDIEELEERWKRYRRKKLLRRLAWMLLLVVVLILPLLYVEVYQGKKKPIDRKNEHVAAKPEHNRSKKNVSVSTEQKTEKIQREIKAASLLQTVPPSMKEEMHPKEKPIRPKMKITFTDEPSKETTPLRKGKTVELSMVKRNDAAVIRSIEKRFPLSRDYDDAMYLAKYYYSKHRYKKAEYWAMQANVIDSSKVESWILFAKSKAKRGHRTEAIRILQRYYDNTGDPQVKLLIDAMRKGRKF
ncbi:CDC27 family protein [Nitratifractor sp.]